MIELFKSILSKGSVFLAPYKIYIFIALASILSTFWLVDRHVQYNAGIAHCTQQHADAQAKYEQGQVKKKEAEKQEAVKAADKAATQINLLANEHDKQVDKQNELSKLHPTSPSCALSGDEFLRFNEAISRLQK